MMKKLAGVLAAAFVVLSGRVVAEVAPREPEERRAAVFYVDTDVDFLDLDGLADVLVRNGASMAVVRVPFGRATHLLKAATPGCGFLLSKDIPGREDFTWLAGALQADIVIVTSDPALPKPQPGETIASYGAQSLLDLMAERGFQPLIYRLPSQAEKLLQSNRTRFVIGLEPSLMGVRDSSGHNLTKVEVLRHVELWLGCNAATPAAAAQSVEQAWRKGLVNGDIEKFYQASGLGQYLPRQQ